MLATSHSRRGGSAGGGNNTACQFLPAGVTPPPPSPSAPPALQAAVDDPATYKYCLKSQTLPLLEAACEWYEQGYGLQLDPAK